MTDTTSTPITPATTPASAFPQSLTSSTNPRIHVSLTYSPPSLTTATNAVRSPHAGGIVTFTGTTRSTFGPPGSERPVATLSYSAYAPLALRTMLTICEEVYAKHDLMGIYMVHRLGEVPVGEDSIVIAVSGKHRGECWSCLLYTSPSPRDS